MSVPLPLRRMGDEQGVALVLVLVVLAALTIASTTVIVIGREASRTADRAASSDAAFALAEAGIANAMAVLSEPTNDALDPALLPPPPPDPGARVDTYATGTVTWGGTLSGSTWTLTSIGAQPNPGGPGLADVTRRLVARVPVTIALTQPLNDSAWNFMFATHTGWLCDLQLANSVVVRASIYAPGNVCLSQSARILPTTFPDEQTALAVGGRVFLAHPQSSVGTSAEPLDEVDVRSGCVWRFNPPHSPCSSADNVYANRITAAPPSIAPPQADYDFWYARAAPGPMHPCTSWTGTPPQFENETVSPSRNGSVSPSVDLTPPLSYSCRVEEGGMLLGELDWDASARHLTVEGTVFVDGGAYVGNNKTNLYTGHGSLYVERGFAVRGTSELCGAVAAGHCDFGGWDPSASLFAVVAHGGGFWLWAPIVIENDARFQGALWTNEWIVFHDRAEIEGPMVGGSFDIRNNVVVHPFPAINTVPVGLPGGQANVHATPGPPQLLP